MEILKSGKLKNRLRVASTIVLFLFLFWIPAWRCIGHTKEDFIEEYKNYVDLIRHYCIMFYFGDVFPTSQGEN